MCIGVLWSACVYMSVWLVIVRNAIASFERTAKTLPTTQMTTAGRHYRPPTLVRTRTPIRPNPCFPRQVERDAGHQPFIDLYMEAATGTQEAAGLLHAALLLQCWFREWMPWRRRAREREARHEAARLVQRFLRFNLQQRAEARRLAHHNLERMCAAARHNVAATLEAELREYLNDTAYRLCGAKYLRLWRRHVEQRRAKKRRAGHLAHALQGLRANHHHRAPGRHFLAWLARARGVRNRLAALAALRRRHAFLVPFRVWARQVQNTKLAFVGRAGALAVQERAMQRQQQQQRQAEVAQAAASARAQQPARARADQREAVAAVVVQASMRRWWAQRMFRQRLERVKVFWAHLVKRGGHAGDSAAGAASAAGSSPKRATARQPSAGVREAATAAGDDHLRALLLPGEVDAYWRRYPCPFPGRLLARREPVSLQVSVSE